jgi:hypothetical protein
MNSVQQGYTTTGTQVQNHVHHALPMTGFDVGPLAGMGFMLVLLGTTFWLCLKTAARDNAR